MIMKTLGISTLEMRSIIESEFLPRKCECLEEEGGTLMIKIYEHESGRVDLLWTGISQDRFSSSREILYLVGELRQELDSLSLPHAKAS
jgi:hypothetical protein